MHFATPVRTWRVARLYSTEKRRLYVGNRSEYDPCTYSRFPIRMRDTMTFQNIGLSYWDILYFTVFLCNNINEKEFQY
jgi:hypothetical protein